ncbi:MAG: TIGR02281 family clan AA aspartic protease [Alphaproteobacteria bacterium]|nr:TIGR02281 family clan AA aspartic protease [Alphaproteobacteria bacterium]
MLNRMIVILAILILLTGALFWVFPEVNFDHDQWMRYIGLVAVLGYLLLSWNKKGFHSSMWIRSVLFWVALGFLLFTAYSYRYEFEAFKAKLSPSSGQNISDKEMRFEMANNGHFYVQAEINGKPVRFMVDTGASRVVLSPKDARRLGFDSQNLSFNAQSSTANGMVWSALLNLDRIKIGEQIVIDVPASVSQSELDISLLGMSFLNKLKGYRVERETLTFIF